MRNSVDNGSNIIILAYFVEVLIKFSQVNGSVDYCSLFFFSTYSKAFSTIFTFHYDFALNIVRSNKLETIFQCYSFLLSAFCCNYSFWCRFTSSTFQHKISNSTYFRHMHGTNHVQRFWILRKYCC